MLPYLLFLNIILHIPSSTGLSQNLRGGRELRPLNHPLQKPCTLYKRLMRNEDGSEDESWDCLLDLSDGTAFVDVPPGLDLSEAVSGETTLFAPGMAIVEEGRTASILDPSTVVLGDVEQNDRDRRLAMTKGTVNVVVVRATCGTKVVSSSLETIKSDVFSDTVCLKSQLEACSNGQLTVAPGPFGGGIDVSITDCSDHNAARNSVTTALTAALGQFPGRIPNTYFMYCLPPGIGWTGIAYGYLNSWMSVYNDQWCGYVSAQVHEVGHNFNLGHAGEGFLEYDDQTGFMGYSHRLDDQRMCYNAANMYQLGWLQRVAEFSSRPSGTFTLEGHTSFGTGLQAIRLQGTPAAFDTYIWFNDANGINANSIEGRNEVIITIRATGINYAPTSMVAKLGVGGEFLPINGYYSVKVDSISNGQAVISFIGGSSIVASPVVLPTPAPVTPPTPAPVNPPTPPPVNPPTPPPVDPPTPPPVDPPTPPPVIPPTPAPEMPPTSPPEIPPTSPPETPVAPVPTFAPVPSPTLAPVPPPTLFPTIGFVSRVTSVPVPTSAPVSPLPVTCPNVRRASQCPRATCRFVNRRCTPRRVSTKTNAAIQVP